MITKPATPTLLSWSFSSVGIIVCQLHPHNQPITPTAHPCMYPCTLSVNPLLDPSGTREAAVRVPWSQKPPCSQEAAAPTLRQLCLASHLVPVADHCWLLNERLHASQAGCNVGNLHTVNELGSPPQVTINLDTQTGGDNRNQVVDELVDRPNAVCCCVSTTCAHNAIRPSKRNLG